MAGMQHYDILDGVRDGERGRGRERWRKEQKDRGSIWVE